MGKFEIIVTSNQIFDSVFRAPAQTLLSHDIVGNQTYAATKNGDIIKIMDIGHWYFISKQKWDLIKDGDNLSNKQMFERHSLVTTRSENAFAINDMQYAGTDKFFCIHNNLKSFCRFFLMQN